MAGSFVFPIQATLIFMRFCYRQYDEPLDAWFGADQLSSFLARAGSRNRRSPPLWGCSQLRRLELGRRLPEPFQVVVVTSRLRKNVDYEIHIIEQHPLRLLVALFVCDTYPESLKSLIHRIGDGLDLSGISPAAYDKIIGKRPRILFEFENSDLLGFFVLTSEDGFTDLAFESGCLVHTWAIRLYRA